MLQQNHQLKESAKNFIKYHLGERGYFEFILEQRKPKMTWIPSH